MQEKYCDKCGAKLELYDDSNYFVIENTSQTGSTTPMFKRICNKCKKELKEALNDDSNN